MKAVFTCGGTGGHINPALAVARVLLERRPDSEILFVGAEDGMEATLVPREGFRLETLQISSYMRSLKPSAIRHNVRAALSIRRASMRKALQELAVVDSASRICDIILNLAKTHKS